MWEVQGQDGGILPALEEAPPTPCPHSGFAVTHWATKATCVPGDSCNQVQLNLAQRGGVIAISSHCSYSA